MIDFKGLKSLTIPEGIVTKIVSAGVTLWQAIRYKNQVTSSIGSDKQPFNGGLGYINNQELSGSSGSQRAGTNTTVTGFIPVKQGDAVRIKGCNWHSTNAHNYIVSYTADFGHWGTTQTSGTHYYNTTNNPNKMPIENGTYGGSMDIQSDVSTIVIAKNPSHKEVGYEKIAYIRISVRGDGTNKVDGAELIVTVNEEIA